MNLEMFAVVAPNQSIYCKSCKLWCTGLTTCYWCGKALTKPVAKVA